MKHEYSTQGRDYCFLIMSYRSRYDAVYASLSRFIELRTGLACARADRQPGSGTNLLSKVHSMILGASIVVADVSEHSPNVYYEYGYATAHDRKPILIAEIGRRLPTDLVGLEVLSYRRPLNGDETFLERLAQTVQSRLRSPVPQLRKMIEPLHPFPTYIVAAPRVPDKTSRHHWHPDERRTFGDTFGIRGILTAYGSLFGTHEMPELLHAHYVPADLYRRPANFFLIGSAKVNPGTGRFLSLIQKGLRPQWNLARGERPRDYRVRFEGPPDLVSTMNVETKVGRDGSMADSGLVIRAAHPSTPNHLVMILAGRHSIGTHAACVAVTRPQVIDSLEARLKDAGVALRDKRVPFWASVRGTLRKDGTFADDDVGILDAGGYRGRDGGP